jgi:hypothetical protein
VEPLGSSAGGSNSRQESSMKRVLLFNLHKKSSDHRTQTEDSSGVMLSGMSEKMSIHAIRGYISEASAVPQRGRAINNGPPPSVSSTPPKGKGRGGATPGGQHKGGRSALIACDPPLENSALPENLFPAVTAPE